MKYKIVPNDRSVNIGDEENPRWKIIARHDDKKIFGFFGEYRFLSNFWPAKVHFEGAVYPTAENAYQAAKFPKKHRQEFLFCSPEKAKLFGRNVRDRSTQEAVWSESKVAVMRSIVYAKFVSNVSLRCLLLATGDRVLIEANWWGDYFWGVHVSEEGVSSGENHLGLLLMEVRSSFSMFSPSKKA